MIRSSEGLHHGNSLFHTVAITSTTRKRVNQEKHREFTRLRVVLVNWSTFHCETNALALGLHAAKRHPVY